MKRHLLILALVGSLLVPTLAQPARAAASMQMPRAARPAAAKLPARAPQAQLMNRVLANGLEIIVLEDTRSPLVTIEFAAKNGSMTREPPEYNGLSHLYEHMFFKANPANQDAEDDLQRIRQLGIAWNGQTREESSTTTSRRRPESRTAMEFMRDAIAPRSSRRASSSPSARSSSARLTATRRTRSTT